MSDHVCQRTGPYFVDCPADQASYTIRFPLGLRGVIYTKVFTFFDGSRYRATFKDGRLLSVEDMPPAGPGSPAAKPAPPETWRTRPPQL